MGRADKNYVAYYVGVVLKDTGKALLIKENKTDIQFWIPQSQVVWQELTEEYTELGEEYYFWIRTWLLDKNKTPYNTSKKMKESEFLAMLREEEEKPPTEEHISDEDREAMEKELQF